MSGGGSIFGALSSVDKQITDNIAKIDPMGTKVQQAVSGTLYKLFNPKMPEMPEMPTMPAGTQNVASKATKAPASAAGGGIGAGVKDLVSAPPNTPEGNRLRLSQVAPLAGASNTLLGN